MSNLVKEVGMAEYGEPIAVIFILGDDGTVSANGLVILNGDFNYGSAEEIEEAFADFQLEVTQIK